MFKNLKQEEQLHVQNTRIQILEHSLSNIVNYIKKDIDDPIKQEEFLSGVRVWPWNNMPLIDGEVTNIFINSTKDMDDVDEIVLLFEEKYMAIIQNYYFNTTEFPKQSIKDVRYIITAMETVHEENYPDSLYNDMLRVTFTKILEKDKIYK